MIIFAKAFLYNQFRIILLVLLWLAFLLVQNTVSSSPHLQKLHIYDCSCSTTAYIYAVVVAAVVALVFAAAAAAVAAVVAAAAAATAAAAAAAAAAAYICRYMHQCSLLSIILTHLKLWVEVARHNFK